MAMVYNITEVVKDWLLDRNVPKQEVCDFGRGLPVGGFYVRRDDSETAKGKGACRR